MVELNCSFNLNSRFLKQKTVLLPYISPLFPLPANALKRHFLFGLHTKYECVYFSFAFTYKIIRTLNITAHHLLRHEPDANINQEISNAFSTQFNRDNQHRHHQTVTFAGCIALALLPSAAFAAPATEETVIVEGSATAPDDGENDYNVTSTSAGTKMQMTQRDIPQSVTIVSQQRMEDQQLQTLGEVMENTLGISKVRRIRSCSLLFPRIPDR